MVVTVLFIWSRSVYSKDASSAQSVAVQGFLDKIASFFGIALQLNQQIVRNLAHLLEFFILGIEIALYGTYGRHPVRQDFCHMGAAVFAVGFIDETLQIIFHRGPTIADVWIDFAGGLFGMLLIFAVYFMKNASKKRRR
jgi:VanZ family protein